MQHRPGPQNPLDYLRNKTRYPSRRFSKTKSNTSATLLRSVSHVVKMWATCATLNKKMSRKTGSRICQCYDVYLDRVSSFQTLRKDAQVKRDWWRKKYVKQPRFVRRLKITVIGDTLERTRDLTRAMKKPLPVQIKRVGWTWASPPFTLYYNYVFLRTRYGQRVLSPPIVWKGIHRSNGALP